MQKDTLEMSSRNIHYILRGTTPVACPNLLEWADWWHSADKQLAYAEGPEVCISTVFLGIDHAIARGTPVLFETVITGGDNDGESRRYTTWEDAIAGHDDFLKKYGIVPLETCSIQGPPVPACLPMRRIVIRIGNE